MKKLLFVTALLAMGTMAMGQNPSQGEKSKAEVLVKAQIVDDFFKITDINGNPLVLDFGRVPKADYSKGIIEEPKATVEYKVTATEVVDPELKLTMSLTSYEHPDDETATNTVIISKDGVATGDLTENERIEVKLSLDNTEKVMKAQQSKVVGKLNGAIKANLSSTTEGAYSGKVFLVATVKQ